MHYLHKILVYVPDVVSDRSVYQTAELLEAIRDHAEKETKSFYGHAFDWRETGCSGRWSTEYPTNVLLSEDDPARFVSELFAAKEEQKKEIQYCLKQLEETVGTDLKQLVKGLLDRESLMDDKTGVNCMTSYYLHCIAAHLHGEYRCDSYFYNTHECSAWLYPVDIEAIKSEPNNWALVMFDCHY